MTESQNPQPVTDNSGSLTVDAPVGTPVFVRLSDGSTAIATLPISAASLPLPTGASTLAKQPALGTAGTSSADVITVQGVSAANPLNVGSRQTWITQNPTASTSPAYTAADAIGGLLTFANAALTSGGSGVIQTIRVLCKTQALIPSLELVLFNQTFTAIADNAAFNPSDGDMANCIGVIKIGDWADYSLNSIATRTGLGFAFKLSGTTSLFGQLVTRSAITLVGTGDLDIGLEILQDA